MTDEHETETETPSNEGNSVYDTARRVYEELEAKGNAEDKAPDEDVPGGEGEKAESVSPEDISKAAATLARSRKRGKGPRQVIEAKDLDLGAEGEGEAEVEAPEPAKTYEPPLRLSPADKELFAKLPPEGQRWTAEAIQNLEGHYTKRLQDLSRYEQRYGSLAEVEQTYRPHLDKHGLDFAAGTRQLWAVHHEIAENKMQGLSNMLRRNGVTPEDLYRYQQGGGHQQHQPQQNYGQPQSTPLTHETVEQIIAARLQAVQEQQALQQEAQALETLRHEKSADGRYLYPELWDNQAHENGYWNIGTIQRVKPLVESLRKTQQGMSLTEATKKAISALRALDGTPGSPSPAQGPRLSQQEQVAKVRAASVSVKSRGNGAIPTTGKAPKGSSVRDAAEALYSDYFDTN